MSGTTTSPSRRPFVGPCVVLYDGTNVADAWRRARDLVLDVRPPSVEVHAWWHTRASSVVDALRRELSTSAVGLGPGLDPIASRWREHRNGDSAVAEVVALTRAAQAAALDAIVFDPEAAWKGADPTERVALNAIAAEAVSESAKVALGMPLWVTTYDGPARVNDWGGHGDFAWGGWLRPGLTGYVAQVYYPGALGLRTRARYAAESFDAAVRRGLIAPGVARRIELQLHDVPAVDLVATALDSLRGPDDLVLLWAAGTVARCDAEGVTALRVLCAVWRAGLWGADAVRALQRLLGVRVDGDYGRITHDAAVRWSVGR